MIFQNPIKALISKYKKKSKQFSPKQALEYISDEYKKRIKGYNPEEDEDMLLFQSGVYDWGSGPNLEIDFIRQFIKNEEILQLHVIFKIPSVQDETKKYTQTLWLSNLNEISKWQSEILTSDLMQDFGSNKEIKPKIYLENAE